MVECPIDKIEPRVEPSLGTLDEAKCEIQLKVMDLRVRRINNENAKIVSIADTAVRPSLEARGNANVAGPRTSRHDRDAEKQLPVLVDVAERLENCQRM